MQLTVFAGRRMNTVPFSILGRIGGDATLRREKDEHPIPAPFSILGRIGGDATCPPGDSSFAPYVFQYPRSDRRRCNQVLASSLT